MKTAKAIMISTGNTNQWREGLPSRVHQWAESADVWLLHPDTESMLFCLL